MLKLKNFFKDNISDIKTKHLELGFRKALLSKDESDKGYLYMIYQSTGYFSSGGVPIPAGEYSSNNLKYGLVGSLIKFVAPEKFKDIVQKQQPAIQPAFGGGGLPVSDIFDTYKSNLVRFYENRG